MEEKKVQRNANGTFAKGHERIGGMSKGARQSVSAKTQDAIMLLVCEEVSSDRFKDGLTNLYDTDRKSYYQVIGNLAKFAAPTLQSQNIEVGMNEKTHTFLDERLAAMTKKD